MVFQSSHAFVRQLHVFSKHRPSGPLLSISRFVHMCVCLFVSLCVCSLLKYRLNVFLPLFSKVGCPKILEILNPLGKRNGKKWSQIGKLITGVKSPRKTKLFWGEFRLTEQDFLVSVFLTLFNCLFAPTSQSPMSIFGILGEK